MVLFFGIMNKKSQAFPDGVVITANQKNPELIGRMTINYGDGLKNTILGDSASAATVDEISVSKKSSSEDPSFLFADPAIDGAGAIEGTITKTEVENKTYTIKKGDTVSKIAKRFGVTVDKIYQSNPTIKKQGIRVGQKITITIERVVKIKTINTQTATADLQVYANLPKISGYFIKPADAVTNGQLHDYNAVDFVTACDSKVVAAASGIIIPDPTIQTDTDEWNDGYGRFLLIEHENGTRTRYAHLEKTISGVGDVVKQGQQIATVGKTGEISACTLTFEVYKAQNPFGFLEPIK
jgi:murein DD-endopeptidase MepM/ murein hydrolase activator NlpD